MAWYAQTDSTLRTKVRRLINQPSAVDITNTDIDYWIDMGAQAISNESLCRHKSSFITLVQTQRSYSVPASSIKVHNALYTGSAQNTITVSSAANTLNFTHSITGALDIIMPDGVYLPDEFAAELEHYMESDQTFGADTSVTVAWDPTAGTFSITVGTGTIAFTYADSDSTLADAIGFTADEATSATITGGVVSLAAAWTSSASALVRVHPRLFKNLDEGTAGPPVYWTEFDNYIHIHPVPSASEVGHELYIFYSANISESANKTIYLPDYLQEYVVFYAAGRAFEAQGKLAPAQQYMSIFNNFMRFHKAEKLIQPVDSRDMMKLPERTQFVD